MAELVENEVMSFPGFARGVTIGIGVIAIGIFLSGPFFGNVTRAVGALIAIIGAILLAL